MVPSTLLVSMTEMKEKLAGIFMKLQEQNAKISKDLEIARAEVESHKSKAEKLRAELNVLKIEWADLEAKLPLQGINNFLSSTTVANDLTNLCQEIYRLGFKDAIDLAKKKFSSILMQLLKSELFDSSVSKESVEALRGLRRPF
ncbi:hypothetical protein ACH5RR_032194 [Cinchona calisaya]|uniref:FRIGIDA-like protein n=1 Tax=Cinchona calisaya TaxID=153742 RepID=A0ABD2YKH1_9GENT